MKRETIYKLSTSIKLDNKTRAHSKYLTVCPVGPDKKEKIMKRSMILILTVLSLSLFAFSEVKIGVVNGQDVIQKTKRGQSIRTRLENLGKAKQTQIENLEKDIVALQKDLNSPALNAETKEKKGRELEDKKISYQRVVQDAQKEFQAQQQKEMMTMYNEIMPLIQELGKAKGFSLILDVASSGIAYFDPSIDITNDVIKAVDAKFPQ